MAQASTEAAGESPLGDSESPANIAVVCPYCSKPTDGTDRRRICPHCNKRFDILRAQTPDERANQTDNRWLSVPDQPCPSDRITDLSGGKYIRHLKIAHGDYSMGFGMPFAWFQVFMLSVVFGAQLLDGGPIQLVYGPAGWITLFLNALFLWYFYHIVKQTLFCIWGTEELWLEGTTLRIERSIGRIKRSRTISVDETRPGWFSLSPSKQSLDPFDNMPIFPYDATHGIEIGAMILLRPWYMGAVWSTKGTRQSGAAMVWICNHLASARKLLD